MSVRRLSIVLLSFLALGSVSKPNAVRMVVRLGQDLIDGAKRVVESSEAQNAASKLADIVKQNSEPVITAFKTGIANVCRQVGSDLHGKAISFYELEIEKKKKELQDLEAKLIDLKNLPEKLRRERDLELARFLAKHNIMVEPQAL